MSEKVDFERVWNWFGTITCMVIMALFLTLISAACFTSGQTKYCHFVDISTAVKVIEHRDYAPDTFFVAPSYEAALDYASRACPNFHLSDSRFIKWAGPIEEPEDVFPRYQRWLPEAAREIWVNDPQVGAR